MEKQKINESKQPKAGGLGISTASKHPVENKGGIPIPVAIRPAKNTKEK